MKTLNFASYFVLGLVLSASLMTTSIATEIPVLDRSIQVVAPVRAEPQRAATAQKANPSGRAAAVESDRELKIISIIDSHLDEDTLKRIARSHALFNRHGLNTGVLLLGLDLRHFEPEASERAPKPVKSLTPFMDLGVYFAIDPVTIERIEKEVAAQGHAFGVPATVVLEGEHLFVGLGGTPRLALERFLETKAANPMTAPLRATADALRREGL